jgi:hypothetical protein
MYRYEVPFTVDAVAATGGFAGAVDSEFGADSLIPFDAC